MAGDSERERDGGVRDEEAGAVPDSGAYVVRRAASVAGQPLRVARDGVAEHLAIDEEQADVSLDPRRTQKVTRELPNESASRRGKGRDERKIRIFFGRRVGVMLQMVLSILLDVAVNRAGA